jgi:hypothetical protein
MNKPITSGFIPEPAVGEDYLFGVSAIDNDIKVLDGDWTPYLPKNEKQRQGFESMCCTNFSSTSAIEILLTRLIELKLISVGNLKWLNDNGYIDDSGHINFSDRFDALVSGTKPDQGNSLKAPADAKHKYGLIPEKLLPWVDSEAEYFNKSKITPQMYALGLEFLKRFPINYELVYRKDFVEALKVSPLAGAVWAWNGLINNVYQTTTNAFNHAIAIIKPPYNWGIFDSYDPFQKKLADDYNYYDYAIRYIVREITGLPNQSVKKNMYILRRDPRNPNEVYAFNEEMNVKRHIANKGTLKEGARGFDQYWAWDETTPIVVASQAEFDGAMEMAEILLLTKDSEISTGTKFNIWKWLWKFIKVNN